MNDIVMLIEEIAQGVGEELRIHPKNRGPIMQVVAEKFREAGWDVPPIGVPLDKDDELYNADPNCDHRVVSGHGGGIVCTKCKGWFCY